jgi:glycine cleavage system H protein
MMAPESQDVGSTQEISMAYPAGYKYTKDHEWIEITGDRGKVGITDYAQQQLGDVVYMELPEIGATLTVGQSFGTIESVKAVSELYSPVAGEVVEVNTALKQKPEAVNSDPHGSWMIVVRLTDGGDTAGLLDAPQYEALTK